MKFFNKWSRQTHRWVAIPTFLSIPLMLFAKFTKGAFFTLPPQVELAQQLLILYLAITGTYLYFIPYIVKRQRTKRKKAQAAKVAQEK